MKAVFKKEIRALFFGMTGALTVAIICAVLFLYFIFNNLRALSPDLAAPMNATSVLALTFAVPFLTMRAFAEERRNKTDQLLFTAPVSVSSIVLGKFCAYAALLAIPALIACALPLILTPYGEVQYLYCYTSILGFYLYALMITAIGMFVSTLTQNLFAAGLTSFLIVLLGVLLGGAYGSISNAPLRTLLQAVYDFGARLSSMMSGLFDWTGVVYFLSVGALFLFLCTQSLKRDRKKSPAPIVLAAVVCVLVNAMSAFLPANVREWDVTRSRMYSISEASQAVAAGLEDDVTLYYLSAKDAANKDENIERVLRAYADASDHIKMEYVDTVVHPQFYADYSDTQLSQGSVVVVNETNGQYRAIDLLDLVVTQMDFNTFSQYITGYDVEGRVTNALQMVTAAKQTMAKAYATSGHGETAFEESFAARFARAGFDFAEIDLQRTQSVPVDAALLVVNGVKTDLTAEESKKILAFLETGGNLLLITDYAAEEETPHLDDVLAFFDVENLRGLVVETDPAGYYYSGTSAAPLYIFPLIVEDDVTQGLLDQSAGSVFVPQAQAFGYDLRDEKVLQTPLLITSPQAFLKTDLTNETLQKTDADIEGQFALGLKSVKKIDETTSSTACFYSSPLIFTEYFDTSMALGLNAQLFGNTLNALSPEDRAFVTIPVKTLYNRLSIRANTAIAWTIALVLLIPLILIAGAMIRVYRRRL